jgi:hypothetical protein
MPFWHLGQNTPCEPSGLIHTDDSQIARSSSSSPIRDIAPVAGIIRVPNVILVNPSFPAKTVPEFIAYAKANPGKLNMASAGNGSPSHVSCIRRNSSSPPSCAGMIWWLAKSMVRARWLRLHGGVAMAGLLERGDDAELRRRG